MKRIDLQQLRESIRKMNRRQKIYEVLRDELTALGYWRKLSRGKPFTGDMK